VARGDLPSAGTAYVRADVESLNGVWSGAWISSWSCAGARSSACQNSADSDDEVRDSSPHSRFLRLDGKRRRRELSERGAAKVCDGGSGHSTRDLPDTPAGRWAVFRSRFQDWSRRGRTPSSSRRWPLDAAHRRRDCRALPCCRRHQCELLRQGWAGNGPCRRRGTTH